MTDEQAQSRGNFERAIAAMAIEFAQKVIVLADPDVQTEHQRGLEAIDAGRGLSLDDLRTHLELR